MMVNECGDKVIRANSNRPKEDPDSIGKKITSKGEVDQPGRRGTCINAEGNRFAKAPALVAVPWRLIGPIVTL